MIFQHFHNEAGSFTYETNKKFGAEPCKNRNWKLKNMQLFGIVCLMELVGRQGGGIDPGLSLTAFWP